MSDVVTSCLIEPKLKTDAEGVLGMLGLTVGNVILLILCQIVTRRALPFDVKIPNAESVVTIK